MKSAVRLFVCLLLLVGWGLAALSLHVVITPDDIPVTLVTKESFGLKDTWVDTRTWTMDNVAEHPALVQKLIAAGKADSLKHLAPEGKTDDLAAQLVDALHRAPTKVVEPGNSTQPSTATHGSGFFGLF